MFSIKYRDKLMLQKRICTIPLRFSPFHQAKILDHLSLCLVHAFPCGKKVALK